jgi:hypothetical protein
MYDTQQDAYYKDWLQKCKRIREKERIFYVGVLQVVDNRSSRSKGVNTATLGINHLNSLMNQ